MSLDPPRIPLFYRKSLVGEELQKYGRGVRLLANLLLVLAIAVGLMLPNSIARAHEVPCSSDDCEELILTDHDDIDLFALLDHCPPADQCPCSHEQENSEHSPEDDSPPSDDHHPDDDRCPSHGHHHHHHQCVCTSTSSSLIADDSSLSLHPPLFAYVLIAGEDMFIPEPPVYLLDRPPMA